MGFSVVYVHGNGNKVREGLLKSQWDVALFDQDMGASTRMAYWAPLRYPTPLADPASDELDSLPTSPLDAEPPPAAEPPEAFIERTLREVTPRESSADTAGPGRLESCFAT
jgi:hypothetical protein